MTIFYRTTIIIALIVALCSALLVWCWQRSDTDAGSIQPLTNVRTLPAAKLELAGETFTVELACETETRRRGLMFRSDLAVDEGMFFVFTDSLPRTFHMQNCLIDLDIIFLKSDGEIAQITTMAAPAPGRLTSNNRCPVPVQYALEVPAGTCKRLNLQVGEVIELPARIRNIHTGP